MGTELGALYYAISHEVSTLHWRWDQYRELFGEKPSRIDLMNESAPFFFRVFHDTLFESTLLGIARLVGSPESFNNKNLSLQAFDPPTYQRSKPSSPALIVDAVLRAEVIALIEKAKIAGQFAMELRNRHIAHRDLGLALKDQSVDPLPEATRANIETALAAIQAVIDRIEFAYCKRYTGYARSPWGAKALLFYVRSGLLREREKHECYNRMERHPDDINPLPPI